MGGGRRKYSRSVAHPAEVVAGKEGYIIELSSCLSSFRRYISILVYSTHTIMILNLLSRLLPLAYLCLGLLTVVPAVAQEQDPETLVVYLLIGQSNMEGQSSVFRERDFWSEELYGADPYVSPLSLASIIDSEGDPYAANRRAELATTNEYSFLSGLDATWLEPRDDVFGLFWSGSVAARIGHPTHLETPVSQADQPRPGLWTPRERGTGLSRRQADRVSRPWAGGRTRRGTRARSPSRERRSPR